MASKAKSGSPGGGLSNSISRRWQFEARNFCEAARTLGNLLADHPGDGPSLLLLSRTVDYLFRGTDGFDPVFRLREK